MKWKQLIQDLNLFLFYQPNIDIKTAKQILSIIHTNMSLTNQEKFSIDFKLFQEVKSKQKSVDTTYDIKKLRSNITLIKGEKS